MSIEWLDAAAEADLWDGAGTSMLAQGRDITIFRIGDTVFATDNLCTHSQARLCEGFVEGFEIECHCTRAASTWAVAQRPARRPSRPSGLPGPHRRRPGPPVARMISGDAQARRRRRAGSRRLAQRRRLAAQVGASR
jgi:naphthalene 1,2-dioxygenase system ferredoxin subunit